MSNKTETSGGLPSYRLYWFAWGVLLVLTLSMILVESTEFTRILAVITLLVAMAAKIVIIGGWFMHLRFERPQFVITLVAATLLTAAVLFLLIAVDGAQMQQLAEPLS